MTSVKLLLYFLFLFLITIAEGEKKKLKDKIIIHVPYKILKHHHTHTKYKVITIPAPKNEKTVIYLKEEAQPIVKHVPQVQMQEMVAPPQIIPEPITPPHQESATALLESLANHKKEADQQYSAVDEHKSTETELQNTETFIPDLTFKPMILPPQNIIPNFPTKPVMFPQQPAMFTPKFFINPIMHHENFIPKFNYQPMLHLPQYNPKFSFQTQALQDSAHTGSQVYRTIMAPMTETGYKVKEEHHEDHNRLPAKHFNKVPVPSLKSTRKGKSYLVPSQNLRFRNTLSVMQSDPEYEYEHVGYLIIDGNSRKIVGKNLKDETHLYR